MYDEAFRAANADLGHIDWGVVNAEELSWAQMDASYTPHEVFHQQRMPRPPPRVFRPMAPRFPQYRLGQRFPSVSTPQFQQRLGTCHAYNRTGRCDRPGCVYANECARCHGKHPE